MATPEALPPSAAATWSGGAQTPWWVALIAGIALAITGVLILLAPGLTLVVLVQFLGMFWLVDGIVRLASIFVDRSGWGWKLVAGILGIVAGVAVLQHPLWSALLVPGAFVFYMGAMAILLGIIELVMTFLGGGWDTGLLGVVSLLFGLLLAFNPLIGAIALPLLFGGAALVGGIVTTVLAFQKRKGA